MNKSNLLLAILLLLTLHGMQPDFASACPTCKDSLHGNSALGYAISILFMMSMPFTIFSFWVVTIIRLRRKLLNVS